MQYSIHITNQCNLKCFYCYENHKFEANSNTKKFIISKKEVDRWFAWLKKQGNCDSVELIGGEPFLFPEIIDYIFTNYGKLYSFLITTNGTIRNSKVNQIIARYKPYLCVSLDAPQTTASFRIGLNFAKTLQNALDWQKSTRVSINCVLHPYNLRFIKETFDFYVLRHGFKNMHFGCVEEWMNDYYWNIYYQEFKHLVNHTPKKILKTTAISPWKTLKQTKKKFVYQNGIEKIEIFTEQPNNSTYGIYKKACAEYLAQKIN